MTPFDLPLFAYPLLLLASGVFFRAAGFWAFPITVVLTLLSFHVLFFSPLVGLFFGVLPFVAGVLLVCGVLLLCKRPVSPWVLGPSLITVVVGITYVLQGESWCKAKWWC